MSTRSVGARGVQRVPPVCSAIWTTCRFCKRHKCEWGTWSLVEASQTASEMMLAEFPSVRHVYLVSGSCLPLRPVEELRLTSPRGR
jgi:hypothetical protein